jgi:hypothetical protein
LTGLMGDDASHGVRTVRDMLARFGLDEQFSFVNYAGEHFGLPERRIDELMRTTDLFIDLGIRCAWSEQVAPRGISVLIDGEPAATQIKMENALAAGRTLTSYDFYYTIGGNIADGTAQAPSAGRPWRHVFYPICSRLFCPKPVPDDAPFTTVMSWQAHDLVTWRGVTYGAKDMEFDKFIDLPTRVRVPMEVALGGRKPPVDRLNAAGWRVRGSHALTPSVEGFLDYIDRSRGEFTVCKNVFVATGSGWFGDRAAAYLASARPVVMQDTGFSRHLPCGRGLFAVTSVEEAAAAIEEIAGNYQVHSKAAREIALEHLEARTVLGRFLREVGL